MYRTILFLGVLGVAAFTPIVMTTMRDGEATSFFGRFLNAPNEPQKDDGATNARIDNNLTERLSDPIIASLLKPPIRQESKAVRPVVTPIPEVLRFDMTPGFITQRWPRVSGSLPDLSYHGMRVPIMTGTASEDLHGSASYFFNRSHQLERIGLHGYTDNPESVIQFVMSTYRLREYAANGQRLFLSYYQGQPLSLLRIRRAEFGNEGQFEVILELNAPVKNAVLSDESLNYLTSLREANLL